MKATIGELSMSTVEGIPLKTAAGHRGEKEEGRERRGEIERTEEKGEREEKREGRGEREERKERDCVCFGCSGELANKIIENLPKGERQESIVC